jgi:dolichyl-phosphate-mannose-protein mannosyltransferase
MVVVWHHQHAFVAPHIDKTQVRKQMARVTEAQSLHEEERSRLKSPGSDRTDGTGAMIETTVPEMAAGEMPNASGRVARYLAKLQAIDWTPLLLMLLIVASFGFRILWLDKPDGALIFDEEYYVNAARVILGWPVAESAPYARAQPGFDPNTEHPPGAKLLIAASMWLFGDNALGWRLANVAFGTLSVPLLYGIVRQIGAAKPVALLATFLYAFDNLVLVHSRIATLDIFVVSLLLLGLYCYLAGKPTFAGLAFVAATLCKIQGVYGIAAIVVLEGLRLARMWVERRRIEPEFLRQLLITIVVYVVAFPWLLGVLDSVWNNDYKNSAEHIRHIFEYGFALTRPEGPQGQESTPWQWLVNEVPMTYLRTDEQILVGDAVEASRPTIFFRGAMNPYVIFIAPLAIAYAGYSAIKWRDDCSFLVLALFVVTYAPFWPAAILAHRISYLFYFLPTIPSITIGASQFMYAPQMPRVVRWAYIGAVLLGFYTYFPFLKVP